MRPRLLSLLMCPWCRGDFSLSSFDAGVPGADVCEGLLQCACGRRFPIVNGIPRILDHAFALFPDFVYRHRDQLPPLPEVRTFWNFHLETVRVTRASLTHQAISPTGLFGWRAYGERA